MTRKVIIIIFYFVITCLGGCNTIHWFSEKSEKNINYRTTDVKPMKPDCFWNISDGSLTIKLNEYHEYIYDVEETERKYRIVISEAEANERSDVALATVATFGIMAPMALLPASTDAKEDRDAIHEIVDNGKEEYGNHKRFFDGEQVHIIHTNVPGNETRPANNIRVKLLLWGKEKTLEGTTNNGCITFCLGEDIDDYLAIEPGQCRLEAQYNNEWISLGTMVLSEEQLKQMQEYATTRFLNATGKPLYPPVPVASLQVITPKVKPGSNCEIDITVQNKGQGALYRLTATTTSNVIELMDEKIELGKILPGKSRTKRFIVSIDRDTPPKDVCIKFDWSEYNNNIPKQQEARISITTP